MTDHRITPEPQGEEMASSGKVCFVIGPIGGDSTPERKHADQTLKHIIRPAAAQCGYAAVRADQIDRPGIITSQVIERLIEAPLAVADLTGHNPNVFYELAVRHAIRKPLVQLITASDTIPFDVSTVFGARDPDRRHIAFLARPAHQQLTAHRRPEPSNDNA